MVKNEKEDNNFQEKFMQLQVLNQKMQLFSQQIQQIQIEKMEIENALDEIKPSDKKIFKIVGGLMIEKDAKEIQKELNDRNSDLISRLRNIEKEEKVSKEKLDKLQKELMSKLK